MIINKNKRELDTNPPPNNNDKSPLMNESDHIESSVSEAGTKKIQQINFLDCRYYPSTGKVTIKGKESNISPIQAQILTYLSKNQEAEITLENIKSHIWSDKDDVSDVNVHAHLSGLRKVLGDNTKPHRYIVYHKNGTYCLKPLAKIIYVKSRQEKKDFAKKMASRSFLAVSTIFLFAFWSMQPAPTTHYEITGVKPLTTLNGVVWSATVSPDSKIIVFPYKKDGQANWGLQAKVRGSERYQTLMLDDIPRMHNTEPSFSSDGKKLAWVRTNYHDQCEVMVADFIEAELVLENKKSVLDCSQKFYARFPQWKNENTLLASLPQGHGSPNVIFEIDLLTLKTKKITNPNGMFHGEISIFYNQDNDKVAHIRRSSVPGIWTELYIYDFSTKEDILLKTYPYPLYSVAWVDDEKLLARSGRGFELVTVDGATIPVESVNLNGGFMPFALGGDSYGMVLGGLVTRSIIVTDLKNSEVRDSFSSISDDSRPVVAKKSGDFAFVSNRNGQRQIYLTNNDVPEVITNFLSFAPITQELAIAPNGELVAYVVNNQLKIIDREGRTHFKEDATVSGMSFTLDGNGFLYGIESHGGSVVRYLSLSGADKGQTRTLTQGFMPKSADDGLVYFLRKVDGADVLFKTSVNPTGGVLELGLIPFSAINSNAYDVIDNKLYYVIPDGKNKRLVTRDFSTGEVLTVSEITSSLFSLNHDATILITTQKNSEQNNLFEFQLVEVVSR